LIQRPSMGLLRRPTPGEIMEGGRFSRPYGPGAHSRTIRETSLRLRRHSAFQHDELANSPGLFSFDGGDCRYDRPITAAEERWLTHGGRGIGPLASWPISALRSLTALCSTCSLPPRRPSICSRADRGRLRRAWRELTAWLPGSSLTTPPPRPGVGGYGTIAVLSSLIQAPPQPSGTGTRLASWSSRSRPVLAPLVCFGSCRVCARLSGARTTIGSTAGPDQDLRDRQEHDHAQQRPDQP
jgi:hypothetical protein